MGELAEENRQFEELPEWVPQYLAAWGSTRPDGRCMSVKWAAGLVGVDPSTVRHLRSRSRAFRTLEYIARHGGGEFMASYAEAGLRGSATAILRAFLNLVIDERNPQATIQAMKWLLARPDEVDLNLSGAVAQGSLLEWAEIPDGERDQVAANLQAALGVLGRGPADVDDPAS